MNLIGKEWQKVSTVTSTEAPCILGIGCKERVLQGPKRILVGFGIGALESEDMKQVSDLTDLS